jgi:hypothetical protein
MRVSDVALLCSHTFTPLHPYILTPSHPYTLPLSGLRLYVLEYLCTCVRDGKDSKGVRTTGPRAKKKYVRYYPRHSWEGSEFASRKGETLRTGRVEGQSLVAHLQYLRSWGGRNSY